jgi:hypothetical protein
MGLTADIRMDITQPLGWLKLPQTVLWGLLIVSGLMLWGPPQFVTGLGLASFIQVYRMYLGVAFLFFAVATVPRLVANIVSWPLHAIQERRAGKQRIARLSDLSPQEKALVCHFLVNDTRSVTLSYTDGLTQGLVHAGIIYRASNLSQGGTRFAYNIQPWAWDYLREHPEILN